MTYTLLNVLLAVEEHTGVTLEQMTSKKRKAEISYARSLYGCVAVDELAITSNKSAARGIKKSHSSLSVARRKKPASPHDIRAILKIMKEQGDPTCKTSQHTSE